MIHRHTDSVFQTYAHNRHLKRLNSRKINIVKFNLKIYTIITINSFIWLVFFLCLSLYFESSLFVALLLVFCVSIFVLFFDRVHSWHKVQAAHCFPSALLLVVTAIEGKRVFGKKILSFFGFNFQRLM